MKNIVNELIFSKFHEIVLPSVLSSSNGSFWSKFAGVNVGCNDFDGIFDGMVDGVFEGNTNVIIDGVGDGIYYTAELICGVSLPVFSIYTFWWTNIC